MLLTHFHADHVEGLPGVLRGRAVGVVVTSPLDDPPGEERRVLRWLDDSGATLRTAAVGDEWRIGDVHLRVVWPSRLIRGEGSDANNASVTVLAEVGATTFALGGDLEEVAQDAVLAQTAATPVDVVKVPHHGSRYQSPGWATSCGRGSPSSASASTTTTATLRPTLSRHTRLSARWWGAPTSTATSPSSATTPAPSPCSAAGSRRRLDDQLTGVSSRSSTAGGRVVSNPSCLPART